MARAASLLVVSAAVWLCLCSQQTGAFWLPSWASWYKKPDVATAYSYPASVEPPAPAPPQQFSGHSLYGGAQPVPVVVPYPVPVGPHLQVGTQQQQHYMAEPAAANPHDLRPPRCFLRAEMPPNAGQLSLSSYVSGGGNSVASDAGGTVGVSVGGMQLVPCWCSVNRVESEEAAVGLGSGPGGGSAGGSFSVQASQPVGN